MATKRVSASVANEMALEMLRSIKPADAKAHAYLAMAIRRLEIATESARAFTRTERRD